jgi:hypothetical protein
VSLHQNFGLNSLDPFPKDALIWIQEQLDLEETETEKYLYFTNNSLSTLLEVLLNRKYDLDNSVSFSFFFLWNSLDSDFIEPAVRLIVDTLNVITTHSSNRLGKLDYPTKVLLVIFDLTKRPKFYQLFGQDGKDPV